MFKRICFCSFCVLLMAACAPARSQLVIQEHLLSAPPDVSTDQLIFHFAQGDQTKILDQTRAYRDFRSQEDEYNRRALEPFGYELRSHLRSANGNSQQRLDIYRGDQPIARDIITLHPISLNTPQTDFIGLADLPDGTYIFTRHRFVMMPPIGATQQPYAYAGDRLLSLDLTDVAHGVSRVQVYLAGQRVYSGQFNNVSTYGSFDGPWAYGNHWALVLLDAEPDGEGGWNSVGRLIQDGEDVNVSRGYEQSFQFTPLDGHPFYFYQKAGRIGISFDGQEIAKGYDEVPHYQCCTPALLNPGHSMNMVWFFARRGDEWYYVQAYLRGKAGK